MKLLGLHCMLKHLSNTQGIYNMVDLDLVYMHVSGIMFSLPERSPGRAITLHCVGIGVGVYIYVKVF